MKTEDPPKLHLDRSRSARSFDTFETLWAEELTSIIQLLLNHQRALEKTKTKDLEKQPTLSIAILGNHGSGKTSLLRTLVERINRPSDEEKQDEELQTLQAFSLPVLAPGLMAPSEQFLYTFLATLWDEIEKPSGADRDGRHTGTMLPLERKFQEVSEHLQVLHAGDSKETDPWGVSLELLEKHRSGRLLAEKLRELISEFSTRQAVHQGGTLVLMPVDDADLAFDRLRMFLSTYRRLLIHPRLVPVVTFSSVLAEELLWVHFARELELESLHTLRHKEPLHTWERLSETYAPTRMARHLATQLLAKSFPIRSRIRVQLGALRVRYATYLMSEDDEGSAGRSVAELLRGASKLLFGQPKWNDRDELIRLPLRPTMLSRQLQVVDALAHAIPQDLVVRLEGSAANLTDQSGKSTSKPEIQGWAEAFDTTAWALFNIHRDVLKQLEFYVEDMQGWSRRGLTRLLLDKLLSLKMRQQRALLQPWIRGQGTLRSEVLSLLAVYVTRPPVYEEMEFIEPPEQVPSSELLPISSIIRWFLNLWLDLYLPQLMASARTRGIYSPSTPEELAGELEHEQRSMPGTLLLDYPKIAEILSKDTKAGLLTAIWCDVTLAGHERRSALYLPRGLRLIQRLLADDVWPEALRESDPKIPKDVGKDPAKIFKDDPRVDRVVAILCDHCKRALWLGYPRRESKQSRNVRQGNSKEGTSQVPILSWEETNQVRKLAIALVVWRVRCEQSGIRLPDPAVRWDGCFMRRLHGEALIGDFWRRMNAVSLECPKGDWNVASALSQWIKQLLEYWDRVDTEHPKGREYYTTVRQALERCPILRLVPSRGKGGAVDIFNWADAREKLRGLKEVEPAR